MLIEISFLFFIGFAMFLAFGVFRSLNKMSMCVSNIFESCEKNYDEISKKIEIITERIEQLEESI